MQRSQVDSVGEEHSREGLIVGVLFNRSPFGQDGQHAVWANSSLKHPPNAVDPKQNFSAIHSRNVSALMVEATYP